MKSIIPITSPIYQQLETAAKTSKVIVFSGLPGVGKSLYINQFKQIAQHLEKKITVIQWDVARKAFETPEISAVFPMGNGVVHNGVKLSVGAWLIDTLKHWLTEFTNAEDLLLIEAPLVGHRFIELAKTQDDEIVENFLKSPAFQMIVPIPSKEVRAKIEVDRRTQLSDDAKNWTGAKPAVMLMLWKMVCGIANDFGKNIPMDGQPPYEPSISEFVFREVLKHRHFIPLYINEIFDISVTNEGDLHNIGSLKASDTVANHYAFQVQQQYSSAEIDNIVKDWYLS